MITAPTAGCQTPTFHCLLLPVWILSLWRPQTTHVAHLCLFTRPRSTYQTTEQSGRCRQTSGNTRLTSNRWLAGVREKEAIIRCKSETKTAISQLWNASSDTVARTSVLWYQFKPQLSFGEWISLPKGHKPSYWFFSSKQSHVIVGKWFYFQIIFCHQFSCSQGHRVELEPTTAVCGQRWGFILESRHVETTHNQLRAAN